MTGIVLSISLLAGVLIVLAGLIQIETPQAKIPSIAEESVSSKMVRVITPETAHEIQPPIAPPSASPQPPILPLVPKHKRERHKIIKPTPDVPIPYQPPVDTYPKHKRYKVEPTPETIIPDIMVDPYAPYEPHVYKHHRHYRHRRHYRHYYRYQDPYYDPLY